MLNDADFCKATNLSGFDVKSNAQKMAAVYRIFILQQIKFEKNGFHKLIDWEIGFQGANFLRNSVIWGSMMLIFLTNVKTAKLASNAIFSTSHYLPTGGPLPCFTYLTSVSCLGISIRRQWRLTVIY